MSYFLWFAFFGRVPNDAGLMVFISAFPASFLADAAQVSRLREPLAALLFCLAMIPLVPFPFFALKLASTIAAQHGIPGTDFFAPITYFVHLMGSNR